MTLKAVYLCQYLDDGGSSVPRQGSGACRKTGNIGWEGGGDLWWPDINGKIKTKKVLRSLYLSMPQIFPTSKSRTGPSLWFRCRNGCRPYDPDSRGLLWSSVLSREDKSLTLIFLTNDRTYNPCFHPVNGTWYSLWQWLFYRLGDPTYCVLIPVHKSNDGRATPTGLGSLSVFMTRSLTNGKSPLSTLVLQ